MVTKNPLFSQDFSSRKLIEIATKTLAANAGSSEIAAIPVPRNKAITIRGILFASAGAAVAPFAATATSGADTLTKVAHGLTTGSPVIVVGTGQPGGVTAGTVYFARAATADTITLYGTSAQAVTGGGVGLVDITSDGSGVVVYPTVLNATYSIFGQAHNRHNYVTAVGSVSVVAVEDLAGWDATVSADNTNKTLRIMATPDVDNPTAYTGWFEVFETPVNNLQ